MFSKSAKRAIFILFLCFCILYFYYKPYQNSSIIDLGTIKGVFYLYFFAVSQTLGIVHESGHGVCYVIGCPEFITVINGTIFQLLFPFGVAIYYYKKNLVASCMALFFTGISLSYTAFYLSTSPQGAILLAKDSFLGVDSYHDFYYILSYFGALNKSKFIAILLTVIAKFIMIVSVLILFILAYLHDEPKNKNRV